MDTSFDKIEVEVDEKGQKHEKATTFINNRIRKKSFQPIKNAESIFFRRSGKTALYVLSAEVSIIANCQTGYTSVMIAIIKHL